MRRIAILCAAVTLLWAANTFAATASAEPTSTTQTTTATETHQAPDCSRSDDGDCTPPNCEASKEDGDEDEGCPASPPPTCQSSKDDGDEDEGCPPATCQSSKDDEGDDQGDQGDQGDQSDQSDQGDEGEHTQSCPPPPQTCDPSKEDADEDEGCPPPPCQSGQDDNDSGDSNSDGDDNDNTQNCPPTYPGYPTCDPTKDDGDEDEGCPPQCPPKNDGDDDDNGDMQSCPPTYPPPCPPDGDDDDNGQQSAPNYPNCKDDGDDDDRGSQGDKGHKHKKPPRISGASRTKSVKVGKDGRFMLAGVSVACPGDGGACSVDGTSDGAAGARKARVAVVFAGVKFSLRAGRSSEVQMRLTNEGKRLLAKKGRLTLVTRLSAVQANGVPVTRTFKTFVKAGKTTGHR